MKYNFPQKEETEKNDWGKSLDHKKAPKKIIFILALFILLLMVSFVFLRNQTKAPAQDGSTNDSKVENTDSGELKKFTSYEELAAFLQANENVGNNISASGLKRTGDQTMTLDAGANKEGWGLAGPSMAPTSAITPDAYVETSAAPGSDHSNTNVQVAGVDEGDIVKTDGNYIYTVSGQSVLIVQALPASGTEIVATIKLDYYPTGLYVSGDRLAVFGSGYNIKPLKEYGKLNGNRNSNYADLRVYDVSDRKHPSQLREYDFEGSYRDSRLIGDYVYFVTVTNPVFAYYKEQPLPYMMVDGAVMAPGKVPSVYYFNLPYRSQNMTSINTINIKQLDEPVKSETYLLDGYQNSMYVSPSNIYITCSRYMSEQQLTIAVIKDFMLEKLSDSDREKIKEIESVKDYILSEDEKAAKITEIFAGYIYSLSDPEQQQIEKEITEKVKARYKEIASEIQKTVIHKINIEGGSLSYQGQGAVPGRFLNQYAMDESADGHFRIATTVDAAWISFGGEMMKSYNNLFVLDKDMKKVGAVEDVAQGETIQSVRFMQDRAYMVTFLRTDPLFVIGLAEASSPQILGQLKVPGYSTYLHPYDDNKIIGLGKNTDENGAEIDGIKLSLFDATDVTQPKELGKYILGDYGSSSSALSDAKAFLFSKEKNLLVIPATVRKADKADRYNSKVTGAGAAVFTVSDTGFELKGLIDHRSESELKNNYYGSEAQRSLYIGENLYSLSNNFLKVNSLEKLESVKVLTLSNNDNLIPVPMPEPMPMSGGGVSVQGSAGKTLK